MSLRSVARRWGSVGAILVASALLSACVTGDTVPDPMLTTTAPTSTPRAGAGSPSPMPSTLPAADPDDPSTWIVSDAGMGPFTLGMPFADAVAVLPGMQDGCGHAYVLPDNTVWLASWETEGILEEATWYATEGATGPHTASGLGIGSTVDEVREEFPDAVHDFRNHDYLQAGRVTFGYSADTGLVDSIGVTTTEPQWEYCG